VNFVECLNYFAIRCFRFYSLLCSLGEIFGGLQLASDCNDAEFLMQTLGNCCSCGSCLTGYCINCGKGSVIDVLSTIKGPWAIVYWQVTQCGKFLCVQILKQCMLFSCGCGVIGGSVRSFAVAG
jgi:hypothetical protein